MFEWDAAKEMSNGEVADALALSRRELMAAECKQLVLAATWADRHAGDFVEDHVSTLPGMPRLVSLRGGGRGSVDGCPQIEEYAAAELAALLGCSTVAGEQLIADAVVLRHRHPLLWTALRAGTTRVWLARKVARRCVQARLDQAQAGWVDAETTPYVTTLPPGRFLALVDAKVIEADPEAAEERARAAALARFVRAGATDEEGMRTLVSRAGAGEVTALVAVVERIAVILAERGDPRPVDVLRAEALMILANPAQALGLLVGAIRDVADPDTETADELAHEAEFPVGDAATMVDGHGELLPGCPDGADMPLLDQDELDGLVAAHPSLGALTAGGRVLDEGAEVAGGGGHLLDPQLLRDLLAALADFDASAFDPVTVFHVHTTATALQRGPGVARVEGIGPMVLGQVRDWLTSPFSPDDLRHRLRVLPVLDAARVTPVDRYEVPRAMSRLATFRMPYEVFPFGTLSGRAADDDHRVPYDPGGPPGQTRLDNLAKLSRFHHRLKTNGGWVVRSWDDGEFWWRTPHGHWFRVDATGTHHQGRDAARDRRTIEEPAA